MFTENNWDYMKSKEACIDYEENNMLRIMNTINDTKMKTKEYNEEDVSSTTSIHLSPYIDVDMKKLLLSMGFLEEEVILSLMEVNSSSIDAAVALLNAMQS